MNYTKTNDRSKSSGHVIKSDKVIIIYVIHPEKFFIKSIIVIGHYDAMNEIFLLTVIKPKNLKTSLRLEENISKLSIQQTNRLNLLT